MRINIKHGMSQITTLMVPQLLNILSIFLIQIVDVYYNDLDNYFKNK